MSPKLKRFSAAFLLAAACSAPAFAADVFVMVAETGGAETGVKEGGEGAAFESSALWEGCLLGAFFEAGHVVSNSPILALGADFPGAEPPQAGFPAGLEAALADARSGGADYAVVALLGYPAASDRTSRPEQVRLRVYALSPYRFVREISAAGGPRTENEAAHAERVIRGLIPYVED
ncbi:MAG: hypothetical protein LBO76_06370 [Treponema sp.]|jgi:hypothetical protein|nr:hypothetical protein [Treponema sp.]